MSAKLSEMKGKDLLDQVVGQYAFAITPLMADLAREEVGIARQFMPDVRELDAIQQERPDPIADEAHSPLPGLVHRYPNRVLMKLIEACPVYCRFCFRREMVGPGGFALNGAALSAVLDYIAADPKIDEVIMTGGDPFMVSARRVREIGLALAQMEHIAHIRWHTRVPMVAPERVDDDFIAALRASDEGRYPKQIWVAIHANHPVEFTKEAAAALAAMTKAGIHLVSQSVLLKGVNDSPDVLAELMSQFMRHGVKPYYLHHADLAPGTGHFRVSIKHGQMLHQYLRENLSGLAVPQYVLDVPDQGFKADISAQNVRTGASGAEVKVRAEKWVGIDPAQYDGF